MPAPYSNDLRKRAIVEVESGASRHEAAEQFGVSPSAVIKWVRRWYDTGSRTAKPSGGSVSPLEKYAQWFFDLIAAQPDLTLDEVMVAKKAARTSLPQLPETEDELKAVATNLGAPPSDIFLGRN